jgi:hypothetical protein
MRRSRQTAATVVEPKVVVTPPTPGAAAADMLKAIRIETTWEIKYAQEHLDKWSERFAKDPVDAFSWSKEIFEAAARKRSAEEIVTWINIVKENTDEYAAPSDLKILQMVRRNLFREVMHGAKWPERSTSPQSNEMAACLMAKRAEWLENIDHKFEHRNLSH